MHGYEIEQLSENERLAAAAIHGGTLCGFVIIAPVIVHAVYKDNEVLRKRAEKAILVQAVILAVLILGSAVTCGATAILVVPWFLYELHLTIQSYRGRSNGYPF